jgi:DNA-binding NtrC family response regulator
MKALLEDKKELVPPAPISNKGSLSSEKSRSEKIPEEKRLLLQTLYDKGYHKRLTAESLGISRRYLYSKMVLYGVPLTRLEMKNYIEKHLGLK